MEIIETLKPIVDIFLHLDKHLAVVMQQYGTGTYFILFCIIFCETGLVVTPFLPGDSLLFATGALCAGNALSVETILVLLCIAAVLGDTVNYAVGHYLGPKVLSGNRFLKKEYLDRTHAFYEKYGAKTIVIARFVPIIRTFAPFLAGVGKMNYLKFATYNVVGGVVWIFSFVLAGYYFGNIPLVKRNFTFVILAIIVLSVMPAVIEIWRSRARSAHPVQKPSNP